MAKLIEVEVRQGGKFKEKVTRPISRGSVCYEGQFHELKQPGNYIELPEIVDDLPEPGELGPPDPEFDRLLGWFCQNRQEIINTINDDPTSNKIIHTILVTPEGLRFFGERKPMTIRHTEARHALQAQ